MRLNQIQQLLAIMEFGSVRGAARHLKVTAPALSRGIRELEEELSVQLLERTAHGVVPTPAGKVFLKRARTIQNELDGLRTETAQVAASGGSVRFGVGWPAFPVLAGAHAAFRRKHPRVELYIAGGMHDTLLPLVREGSIEFALDFIPGKFKDKSMRAYPLWRGERVFVCRKGHPLRHARSLDELVDAEVLTFGMLNDYIPGSPGTWVRELFEQNGVPAPRAITKCNESGLYLKLLTETDAIGVHALTHLVSPVSRLLLEVIDIKLRKPLSTATVYLFHRADAALSPAAAAMVAAIKAEARKLAFSASAK